LFSTANGSVLELTGRKVMAAEEEQEPIPFSDQLAVGRFSDLGRTLEGPNPGLAYRRLDLKGLRIRALKGVELFTHLIHLDLSKNCILDVKELKTLPNILSLDLSGNEISQLKSWVAEEGGDPIFKYLGTLNMSNNQLTALPSLATFPVLKKADFSQNEIAACTESPEGPAVLERLNVSNNKLPSLANLANMAMLKVLDVSANEITDFSAWVENGPNMPELEELNMASNRLKDLSEAPWDAVPNLKTLDVSANEFMTPAPLEALRKLPLLRRLSVAGNPFVGGGEAAAEGGEGDMPESAPAEATEGESAPLPSPVEDPRAELLCCHWRLTVIDSIDVSPDDLERAKALNISKAIAAAAAKPAEEEGEAA